jgi:hypothetical protein
MQSKVASGGRWWALSLCSRSPCKRADKKYRRGRGLRLFRLGRRPVRGPLPSMGSDPSMGRLDLDGRPLRSPTEPDVPVKGIRLVTIWRCPSHHPATGGDTLVRLGVLGVVPTSGPRRRVPFAPRGPVGPVPPGSTLRCVAPNSCLRSVRLWRSVRLGNWFLALGAWRCKTCFLVSSSRVAGSREGKSMNVGNETVEGVRWEGSDPVSGFVEGVRSEWRQDNPILWPP